MDGAIGIIVWSVDSAEEMQRIYENDPAVKAGIGYPELHPFRIGRWAGRRAQQGEKRTLDKEGIRMIPKASANGIRL